MINPVDKDINSEKESKWIKSWKFPASNKAIFPVKCLFKNNPDRAVEIAIDEININDEGLVSLLMVVLKLKSKLPISKEAKNGKPGIIQAVSRREGMLKRRNKPYNCVHLHYNINTYNHI